MKILFEFWFIVLFGCIGYSQQNENKKLEGELLKLKNQAFCDCYSEVLSGKE